MKTYTALLAALLSTSAFGACDTAKWGDRPDIPNGREASFEEMVTARQEVTAYVEAGKAYVACYEPSPFVHSYLVERLERTAEIFNRERERYLERTEVVARS